MSSPLKLDVTVPVLALKLGRNVIQHGTLSIIRSLGSLGVPVYARVEDRFAPAALSRYLTGAFVWEVDGQDPEPLLARLAAVRKQLGRPAILLPTDDLAAVFVAEHAQTLERWFLFPRVPKDLPRSLSNKKELHFLCNRVGVPCPEAAFPDSVEDVHRLIEHTTFPVVVKAVESQRLPKGCPSVSIARTPADLIAMYRQGEKPESARLMLQEYIPESCAEDWIYCGYRNPQTGCLVSFTGRKLRSHPPFTGFTTLGVTAWNDTVSLQTEKLLRAIGYAGIIDMDYRLDKRDSRFKLLDFNPRIGANFRMFEDREGKDVVRALHLDLTGRRVRRLPVVEGRAFVVEPYDLAASLGYMRRGGLTFREWRQSLTGSKEAAWFRRDDPVPSLAMCARLTLRALSHAVHIFPVRTRTFGSPTPVEPQLPTQTSPALDPARMPVLSEKE